MDSRALIDGLKDERARFVRLTRNRVATDADAEDVVQRAMLRAVDHASQIEDAPRARAWFYRILHRTLADHHRRRPPEVSAGALDQEPALEAEDSREACRCAGRLLRELRPAYAEVLGRIDYAGEDPASTAESLGISASNLYVRLYRARRSLRARVQSHCGVGSIEPCLECRCTGSYRCGS